MNCPTKKLIFICFLAITFVSCIEKRITRLDQKAVRRVKADISLLNDVFYAGLKLHPCDNDTLYLPPVIDRKGTVTIDSLKPVYNGMTGNMGYSIVRITETFRDSFPYKVIDTQKIDILTDSINAKNKALAFKDGQIIEQNRQIKQQGKKEKNLWLAISGLIALVVSSNGLWIYLKLRKI